MKTDLERHFDLVVAKDGLATPEQVFSSYKTPINGHKQQVERKENAAFSLVLDELIKDVVKHLRKIETLEKRGAIAPSPSEILKEEKHQLIQRTDQIGIRGRKIWDNKEWEKSLVVAMEKYLFHFLELVLAGERARVTFSKLFTTKARLAEFTLKRYKKEDLLLSQIEESFIKDFVKHITIYHQNSHNTIWKYVQIVKEIIERAFYLGLYRAGRQGMACHGGNVDQRRRKTEVQETLPLLTICLEILEMFKNDPRCLRKGKSLLVTNAIIAGRKRNCFMGVK